MGKNKTINILGVPYTIVEDDAPLEYNQYGFCNPAMQRIHIRSGLCRELRAQALIHEAIHAILSQLSRFEEYEDEQLVQGLAVGLQMALFPDGMESE